MKHIIFEQKTYLFNKYGNLKRIVDMPHSKNDMKEIIINASRNIFARFGFKKTTVDEIANSLYKTKSFIYHYFKSKEEIFQSVVEKESAVLKEEIINAVNLEENPQKKLHT